MKHVFTIHSPITFFSAVNIIFQENIPQNEVVLISDGYEVPFEIGFVVTAYQQRDKKFWHKIKNINLVKAYDTYIDVVTKGAEFTAYIDLMHANQRIIVTHKKCIRFNFIEEGTASYVIPDNLDFITKATKQVGFRNLNFKQFSLSLVRVLRGASMRLLSLPFHPQAYSFIENVKFYTYSKHGYPGVLDKNRILLDVEKIDVSFLKKFDISQKFDNSHIWIEETFPKVYGISESNYIKAILKVLENLKKDGIHHIVLKLRPKNTVEKSLLYKVILENQFSIEIIPNHILAEIVFINSKNLRVIGIISSLLFYATIWGHQAMSLYDLLEEKPETSFDKMKFYWDVVYKAT
jgi:hypothetical protein